MATPPALAVHHWQLYSVTEVDVIVDPFTGLATAVPNRGGPVGELIGCSNCGESFDAALVGQPCFPDDDSLPL